jgi:hypothetical protein
VPDSRLDASGYFTYSEVTGDPTHRPLADCGDTPLSGARRPLMYPTAGNGLELAFDVPYSRRVRSNDRHVPRKISLILIAHVHLAWSKLFEPEVAGKVIRQRGTSNGPHSGRLLFPSSKRHRYGDARFFGAAQTTCWLTLFRPTNHIYAHRQGGLRPPRNGRLRPRHR